MSPLAGVDVEVVDTPTPPLDLTDTSPWFVVGIAERGPVDRAVEVRSIAEFEATFGPRLAAYPTLHDSLRTFFDEGGSRAFVARYVGPDADTAEANIAGATGTSLIISAASPGEWGNGLAYDIDVAGSDFTVKVYEDSALIETSPALADKAAAISWSAGSNYIRLTSGADASDPVATGVNQALAGGVDDLSNATDTHRVAALELFPADLGPGQVSIPAATTSAAHAALLGHARDRNRHAVLDGPDTTTAATLVTAAQNAGTGTARRYGQLWGSWAVIAGPADDTTVKVPWSAVEAGLIARLDRVQGPTAAAAGDQGRTRTVIDLSHHWSEADRKTLDAANVNVAKLIRGTIRAYGFDTLASENRWDQATGSREVMLIAAFADQIAESYTFATITPDKIGEFAGHLTGMLQAQPLHGFSVDTASVNTPQSIQDGWLRAAIQVQVNQFAKRLQVTIAKRLITEVIS